MVKAFAEVCEGSAGGYIHLGATSYDIVDTAWALILKDALKIIISDTGEGMEKSELSKIFQSFSRAKAGRRYWTEGAGLGLYIARKFVEMHQGKIWAKSKGKGKGATFYVEFPLTLKTKSKN